MARKPEIPPEAEEASASAETTLSEEWQGLIASGKAAFESEIAFQKARAALVGGALGRIAALGALVLALLFFVLMALVMGLLLALTPLLGAWGALGAVAGGLLLLTLLAGLGILSGLRRLKRVFAGKDSTR